MVVIGLRVERAWVIGARRPFAQGPAAARRPASRRKRAASGQAEVKWMRTRVAFSMTRAPILSSLSLRVANSARASGAGNGVAQGGHQPVGSGCGRPDASAGCGLRAPTASFPGSTGRGSRQTRSGRRRRRRSPSCIGRLAARRGERYRRSWRAWHIRCSERKTPRQRIPARWQRLTLRPRPQSQTRCE